MKAIVFVDVQNDFIKGGKLAFSYPEADNLPQVVEFAKDCVNSGNCKIYATRDTHQPTTYLGYHFEGDKKVDTVSGGYLASLEGQHLPVEHCIEGTDGWMIAYSLLDVLIGHATFVNKPTFGSYDLAGIVEEDFGKIGPEEIVICGYDLSICVVANAVMLRAKYPDTKISVKLDLCGDVDKEAFDAAVKVLRMQQIEV